MRRLLSLIGCALLGALGVSLLMASGMIAATPHDTLRTEPPPKTVAIAPHRAIYNMNLAGIHNGSNITDVSGRMLFEWRDVCDGWAIQQHMQLHFNYASGEEEDVISTELTWEAKDGKSYNFNIRRVTNGEETENYRGKAQQNNDGTVKVVYSQPEGKNLALPAGTLFPSTHTQMMIRNAQQGEKFFSRRIFDGSDETGSSDISTFISPTRPQVAPASDTQGDKLKDNPLLADAGWPVHMAFFNPVSETGEPDYEMDMTLEPNGVARHLKIDYGDFSVNGSLEEVEALPAPNCP